MAPFGKIVHNRNNDDDLPEVRAIAGFGFGCAVIALVVLITISYILIR